MSSALGNATKLVARGLSMGREDQSFLGAAWVVHLLRIAPGKIKRGLALLFLALSPHYFRGFRLRAEFARNRESRKKIREQILSPHLESEQTVLDYGCGPGWLAHEVSPHVSRVLAVNVSRGVLQCARILNARENTTYLHCDDLVDLEDSSVDLVYSIAVIQHVTDEVFEVILQSCRRLLRDGGKVALHVVTDEESWQRESEWKSDTTIKGRAKLKWGLNCFNRSGPEIDRLLGKNGFSSIHFQEIREICSEDFDDVCRQQLVTAVKLPQASP